MKLLTKLAHQAKTKDGSDYYDFLASLHEKGWSIRSIANALEVSPTTASKHIDKGTPREEFLRTITIPDELLPVQELPTNDWHRLRSLSQWARKAASASPSPRAKQASSDLNTYIRILTDEGYSQRQLAQACNISKTAIAQRIAKTKPGDFTRRDLP